MTQSERYDYHFIVCWYCYTSRFCMYHCTCIFYNRIRIIHITIEIENMSTSINVGILSVPCNPLLSCSPYITIKSITTPTIYLHKIVQLPVCVIYTNGPEKRWRQSSLHIECYVISLPAVIPESTVQSLLKIGILVVNMLFHHKTEFDIGPSNVGFMIESVTVQRESPAWDHHGVVLIFYCAHMCKGIWPGNGFPNA